MTEAELDAIESTERSINGDPAGKSIMKLIDEVRARKAECIILQAVIKKQDVEIDSLTQHCDMFCKCPNHNHHSKIKPK